MRTTKLLLGAVSAFLFSTGASAQFSSAIDCTLAGGDLFVIAGIEICVDNQLSAADATMPVSATPANTTTGAVTAGGIGASLGGIATSPSLFLIRDSLPSTTLTAGSTAPAIVGPPRNVVTPAAPIANATAGMGTNSGTVPARSLVAAATPVSSPTTPSSVVPGTVTAVPTAATTVSTTPILPAAATIPTAIVILRGGAVGVSAVATPFPFPGFFVIPGM